VVTVQPSSTVLVLSAAEVVFAGVGVAEVRGGPLGLLLRVREGVVVALGSGSGPGAETLAGGGGVGSASPESRS
jgi:hypothetical protein